MKAGLPLVYGSFKLSQHILNCLLPNFAICLSLASFWISNACTVESSSSCMLGQSACRCGQRPRDDRTDCRMIPLTTHFLGGVSIRRDRSQAVHHGQQVVSFAAAAGRLLSRLGKLPHDFSQLCVCLLVLLHRVIIVNYLNLHFTSAATC